MSSTIPKLKPIKFTYQDRVPRFVAHFQTVFKDLKALWADENALDISGGDDANLDTSLYTLLVRGRHHQRWAQVQVQPHIATPSYCQVEIKFFGDASTMLLYCALLNTLANGLPRGIASGLADAERQMLKALTAHYAKSLPSLTAKLAKKPLSMHPDTRTKLNDLIQQRAKRIQNNQKLLSRTDAYQRAGLHLNTVRRYAPELHEKWKDTSYLPSGFVDTAPNAYLGQGGHE